MSRIIDLDIVAPVTDLTLIINDERFLIPGDIPIEDYAALVTAANQLDEADGEQALKAAEDIGGLLLALFQVRQPTLEKLPVGLKRLVPLIFVLFNEDLDTGEPDPVPGPPRAEEATAGSTTTRNAGSSRSSARKPRKRAARSRSSSSSAT